MASLYLAAAAGDVKLEVIESGGLLERRRDREDGVIRLLVKG
jgi:hypothetical protein